MIEHYDLEETQNITLAGVIPLMNNYSYESALLPARYFTGKHAVNPLGGKVMNIAFYEGQEPDLYKGETVEWIFYDDEHQVRIIDKATLFVKGLNLVMFLVQLKD